MASEAEREQARARYVAEYPAYEAAAQAMETLLGNVCKASGVRAHVESREKTISSFVKKAYLKRDKYTDPWTEITDKVGARVTVETLPDLRSLKALLSGEDSPFVVHWVDDKSEGVDAGTLYYPGVHIQVTVPSAATSDGEPIQCEIQLRTKAQDLWSVPSHKLVYKPTVEPPDGTKRRVLRLSVLVEMFDEEVERAMDETRADPNYADALLLREIEALYLTFVAEPGEDLLSLDVLELLGLAIPDRDTYVDQLKKFVADHRDKISQAYSEYGVYSAFSGMWNYWLMSQPESLVVFHLIESRPLALAEAVSGSEIHDVLEAAFEVWGATMPEPV